MESMRIAGRKAITLLKILNICVGMALLYVVLYFFYHINPNNMDLNNNLLLFVVWIFLTIIISGYGIILGIRAILYYDIRLSGIFTIIALLTWQVVIILVQNISTCKCITFHESILGVKDWGILNNGILVLLLYLIVWILNKLISVKISHDENIPIS